MRLRRDELGLDDIDRQILGILQDDCKTPLAKVGECSRIPPRFCRPVFAGQLPCSSIAARGRRLLDKLCANGKLPRNCGLHRLHAQLHGNHCLQRTRFC